MIDKIRHFLQKNQVWFAILLALAGGGYYAWQAWGMVNSLSSFVLDESLYIYKGFLFAAGKYQPFQDYGPLTNHMPLSFVIPGYIQVWFGPSLRAARYFVFITGILTVIGLFIAAARVGGYWWGALAVWVVAGFPVVIEKGYYEADYTGKIAWLGHYLFVTGYDEAKGVFIVQDAYLEPGKDLETDYASFIEGWRSFNYTFFVVYPPEREAEMFATLGPWADSTWANQHALEIANREIQELAGIDEFFAWFNKGSSHVALFEYADAGFAYDYAFLLYNDLGNDDTQRPYRIMWYQTGPYWAYHYSGRYNDVIALANNTLNETIAEPTLEESIYWRAMANLALGNTTEATTDFLQAVYLNPNFDAAHAVLAQLGVSP